jgi:hypothetical protein
MAMTETVDALTAAAGAQQDEVTALRDEIDALTGVELTDLLADVPNINARLIGIEAIGMAGEGWFTDPVSGLDADEWATTARLNALDS